MNIEKRIEELGLTLPVTKAPTGNFLPAKACGQQLYVSGSTPLVNGKPMYVGRIGEEVTLEQAAEAARWIVLCELSKARAVLGDLDRITDVVKVTGFMAVPAGFDKQTAVLNAASDLLVEIFGQKGAHARSALGVAALPGNAPLEIEMILAYE